MIIEVVSFILAGVAAGMLSSLFGLGGGLVVVPALYWLFKLHGMNSHEVMHMAVGTSLAVMIVTTFRSILGHYRKQNIHVGLWKKIIVFMAAGSVSGAVASHWLHGDFLRYLFIVLLAGIILRSIFHKGFSRTYQVKDVAMPSILASAPVGYVAGFLSVLLGIGGSVFTVPFLRHCKSPMEMAAGTAVALTPAVSLFGVAGYMWAGLHSLHLPPHSIGYVNIPAFFALSAGTLCGVPLGLKLGSALPDKIAAKIYIGFLAVILLSMLV